MGKKTSSSQKQASLQTSRATSPRARYMVSTSAPEGQKFRQLVQQLRKAGLEIEDESTDLLPTIGTIFGVATPAQYEKLKAVKGVEAVEEQQEIRIPPPGAPVQ